MLNCMSPTWIDVTRGTKPEQLTELEAVFYVLQDDRLTREQAGKEESAKKLYGFDTISKVRVGPIAKKVKPLQTHCNQKLKRLK